MREDLENIYLQMFNEKVVPDDFNDYKDDDFADVEDENLDLKYSNITPNLQKISLKDYNQKQIDSLKIYFRNKMERYKNISDEEMLTFIRKLIKTHPEVMKKTRLHLAALEPDLFDYVDHGVE